MALTNFTATELSSLNPSEIKDLVSEIHDSIETTGTTQSLPDKYCNIWGVLKALLTIAKFFTDDETDQKIDAIIAIGNTTCQ